MVANIRLLWCAVMIIGSAIYGLLVVANPGLAETVAPGYVGALLTIFFSVNLWKK
jgi:hypothetical protein